MRYIAITIEEESVLNDLYKHSPNSTIRKRSQCILLSHQKYKIKDLSAIFKVSRRSIERWFNAWELTGLQSLSIGSGRGVKLRLKEYEQEVKEQLKEHNRNLKNVLLYLKEHHNISICKRTLQNFLKNTGL